MPDAFYTAGDLTVKVGIVLAVTKLKMDAATGGTFFNIYVQGRPEPLRVNYLYGKESSASSEREALVQAVNALDRG